MHVQITIDDEGEGVSVQGQQEETVSTQDEPDFASMSGDTLSAGRASGGTSGFDPAGLGPAAVEGEGLPSQRGVVAGEPEQSQDLEPGTSAPADVQASPATEGTLPHQAQSYPIQPAQRQTLSEGEIFLGNEI